MSNIQWAAMPVAPQADDELLTIQEVADVVRVPVAACARASLAGEAIANSRSSSAVQSAGITSHSLLRDRCRPRRLSRSRACG
jgi:hypothetical protein